jgi:hypothetical protein
MKVSLTRDEIDLIRTSIIFSIYKLQKETKHPEKPRHIDELQDLSRKLTSYRKQFKRP